MNKINYFIFFNFSDQYLFDAVEHWTLKMVKMVKRISIIPILLLPLIGFGEGAIETKKFPVNETDFKVFKRIQNSSMTACALMSPSYNGNAFKFEEFNGTCSIGTTTNDVYTIHGTSKSSFVLEEDPTVVKRTGYMITANGKTKVEMIDADDATTITGCQMPEFPFSPGWGVSFIRDNQYPSWCHGVQCHSLMRKTPSS